MHQPFIYNHSPEEQYDLRSVVLPMAVYIGFLHIWAKHRPANITDWCFIISYGVVC